MVQFINDASKFWEILLSHYLWTHFNQLSLGHHAIDVVVHNLGRLFLNGNTTIMRKYALTTEVMDTAMGSNIW